MELNESALIGEWIKTDIGNDHFKRKVNFEEQEIIILRKDDRYLYLHVVLGELTYTMDGGAFWYLIQEDSALYLVVDHKAFLIMSLADNELVLKENASGDLLYFKRNSSPTEKYKVMFADKYNTSSQIK